MASGWRLQGIPSNNNGARPLIRVEPQQEIGEADNGARALAVTAANGFRQRVVRSMREGVAIDNQQRAARKFRLAGTTCAGIVTPRRTCGPSGHPVASGMEKISYAGYRFPPEIIHQAIWLYLGSPSACVTSRTCWRNAVRRCPTRPFDVLSGGSRTLPLGMVGVERTVNERGEREIWLELHILAKLKALRAAGEATAT
jgi:hypothetical protein